jgi:hypothetical protein
MAKKLNWKAEENWMKHWKIDLLDRVDKEKWGQM